MDWKFLKGIDKDQKLAAVLNLSVQDSSRERRSEVRGSTSFLDPLTKQDGGSTTDASTT
jgi:hypothetical protein